MKRLSLALTAVLLAFLVSCSGETSGQGGFSDLFSSDGIYLGFENIPKYTSPEEALSDGCYVITASSQDSGELYGGSEAWIKFLEDSSASRDAFLRIAYFIDGSVYLNDLMYSDNAYHYFDSEWQDLSDRPYKYLRCLTGRDGIPKKDVTWYVLTDSGDLTYEEASKKLYSSSMEVIESIPDYIWLGFTVYMK